METITEDYISFEIAKLLKEKGFEILTGKVYDNQNKLDYQNVVCWQEKRLPYISAPTLQMAMKYLRKKHKLCIVSMPVVTDDDGDGGCLWNFVISRKLKPLYESEHLYESLETLFNDAIKYCLENLI